MLLLPLREKVAPKGSDEGLKTLFGMSHRNLEIAARPLIRQLR
jgi:hypothetical protein